MRSRNRPGLLGAQDPEVYPMTGELAQTGAWVLPATYESRNSAGLCPSRSKLEISHSWSTYTRKAAKATNQAFIFLETQFSPAYHCLPVDGKCTLAGPRERMEAARAPRADAGPSRSPFTLRPLVGHPQKTLFPHFATKMTKEQGEEKGRKAET